MFRCCFRIVNRHADDFLSDQNFSTCHLPRFAAISVAGVSGVVKGISGKL